MIFTYKPQRQTLGQLTKNIQSKTKKKICFLGRLDPIACGIVCYFTDGECSLARKYMHVDKTYQFNLVVGISTDSQDVLGVIDKVINVDQEIINNVHHSNFVEHFSGLKYEQSYPRFSSFVVKKYGEKKPLWYFSKYGYQIVKEDLPKHLIQIYLLEKIGKTFLIEDKNYFLEQVTKLNDENGELRKDMIINQYQNMENIKFIGIPLIAKVSSGTYIRQLCDDIGQYLKLPAIADKIERMSYHFPKDTEKELNISDLDILVEENLL